MNGAGRHRRAQDGLDPGLPDHGRCQGDRGGAAFQPIRGYGSIPAGPVHHPGPQGDAELSQEGRDRDREDAPHRTRQQQNEALGHNQKQREGARGDRLSPDEGDAITRALSLLRGPLSLSRCADSVPASPHTPMLQPDDVLVPRGGQRARERSME